MTKLPYPRVLLKLSGEALLGAKDFGICREAMLRYAAEVKDIIGLGIQVGIVLGGGNLFRGRSMSEMGVNSVTADQIGMLATIMNALAFADVLRRESVNSIVMTPHEIAGMTEVFERHKAMRYLENGYVTVFAGGTGNPLVTTDSAASLRAVEIQADILLKGTNVEGVYSADPDVNPHAVLYHHISYDAALQKQLAVMDITAFSQCRDNNMPIRVFNIFEPGVLKKVVMGENIGTLVSQGE